MGAVRCWQRSQSSEGLPEAGECFEGGALTWLLVGGLGSLPRGPHHRWLECPHDMVGNFPQDHDEVGGGREREKKVSTPFTT